MQIKSPSISFIILWKVAGALENPKYITVALKRSCLVINAIFYSSCHDLAKRLSHYLYFFSFLFSLDLQLQDGAQESIM